VKQFLQKEGSHSHKPISVGTGVFFGDDFTSSEDNAVRSSEIFEFIQSAFFEPLEGGTKPLGKLVNEGDLFGSNELRKKMLDSFGVVARNDESFLLFQ
jgi:hypothetical protein